MSEISETILESVHKEAQAIVRQAEEAAAHELKKAGELHRKRSVKEQKRLLAGANREAARIAAQGVMEARHKIAAARASVIDDIVRRAREELSTAAPDAASLKRLIREALDGLEAESAVTIGVRARELELARQAVADDPRLAKSIAQVAERPISAGIVAENQDGSVLLDNTFAARLDMLIPRMLVRLRETLFHEPGS